MADEVFGTSELRACLAARDAYGNALAVYGEAKRQLALAEACLSEAERALIARLKIGEREQPDALGECASHGMMEPHEKMHTCREWRAIPQVTSSRIVTEVCDGCAHEG